MDASTIDDATLTKYFFSGRPYKMILERLDAIHGVRRSMSWLKRYFRKLGLRKRCADPPEEMLKAILQVLVASANNLRGYRAMWRILRTKYKMFVRRDTVMKLLRQIDPEGVDQRKGKRLKRRLYHCKGPNYIWHLDGYDKLTPFGLSIHGCIDGKMLWLKLSSSNRDPRVIARYYLESIENVAGCPKVVRADYGTENCSVAKIHIAFRMDHDDSMAGSKSFMYGPSTANIRIEAWWSTLRRFKADWWIDLCKHLQAEGLFNKNNDIHRHTLGYIFGSLLQKDLDEFVKDWNDHPIRRNRHTPSPHGCPNDIYDMPSLYGTSDQLQPMDTTLWTTCMLHESTAAPKLCPVVFQNTADVVLHTNFGLTIDDVTHANCRNIYLQLVYHIELSVADGSF